MIKTPISYYGCKQKLVKEILPMIPPHKQYVEPFIGGAAIFFAKQPSECEVINDYDLRVANFWEVLQNDFEGLQAKIRSTLHHEQSHKIARDVLKEGLKGNKIEYAWAFWVQTNMSFGNKIGAGFAFCNLGSHESLNYRKKELFEKHLYERINRVQIFCRDAIELIKLKDSADTFFYFDPPYPDSDCGHYEGTQDVFYKLIELLPDLKGNWLLSSYPNDKLATMTGLNFWNTRNIDMHLSVDGTRKESKRKTEVLTWNYNAYSQTSLFSSLTENAA